MPPANLCRRPGDRRATAGGRGRWTLGGAAVLREGLRPVRRRDHRAQHRCRRPDQCRGRHAQHRVVPHEARSRRCASTSRCRRPTPRILHPGATPTVTLDEYPGQVFHGHAGAHRRSDQPDLAHVCWSRWTWTTLTASCCPAPTRSCISRFSGGHIRSVTFRPTRCCSAARGCGSRVVRNGVAELVPVTIGRDYGDRVEVLTGLNSTDEVIINPSNSLVSGTAVRLVKHKPGGAA